MLHSMSILEVFELLPASLDLSGMAKHPAYMKFAAMVNRRLCTNVVDLLKRWVEAN